MSDPTIEEALERVRKGLEAFASPFTVGPARAALDRIDQHIEKLTEERDGLRRQVFEEQAIFNQASLKNDTLRQRVEELEGVLDGLPDRVLVHARLSSTGQTGREVHRAVRKAISNTQPQEGTA